MRGARYFPRIETRTSRGGTIYSLNPRTGSERRVATGDSPERYGGTDEIMKEILGKRMGL